MTTFNRFERTALEERFLALCRRLGVAWTASVTRPFAGSVTAGRMPDAALLGIMNQWGNASSAGEGLRLAAGAEARR